MTSPTLYSLRDLARIAGVTPRTVRYYVAQGLLPAPGERGPGAKYSDDHLARLRLIKRLQREHLPLAEIRRRLGELADDDLRALAAETDPAGAARASESTALDYIRGVLATSGSYAARAPRPPAAAPLMVPPPGMPTRSLLRRIEPPPTEPPASDTTLERSQWERVSLAPDVELHVRRPLDRRLNRRVDRLIAIARDLLEEDQP